MEALEKAITPNTIAFMMEPIQDEGGVIVPPEGCLADENLTERAAEVGEYFRNKLKKMNSPYVREIRGKGLLIGVEIKDECGKARPFCEKLMELGLLCKETHDQTIRFAPPLNISREDLDWALEQIKKVLA